MNNMNNQAEIKVYFDGLCKVCSKEIDHYKKQPGAQQIEFIDICSAQFDAGKEGLDPFQVHKVMHVKRKDGTLATRVDAFIEIWKVIPKYNWLARLANKKSVKMALEAGYSGFAAFRPFLPRKASPVDCQDSPYCEVKSN
jgi:predicted DCC family thiol-disulfide oxidoreductase YuxK